MPPANGINKKCLLCGKEFYISEYRIQTALYCSHACAVEARGINKRKCLAGEPIFCEKHGLHTNWRYKKSNDNTRCRFCINEQQLEYYKDPKNKFKIFLNQTRHRSKKSGRDFDLTEDFLKELLAKQNNKCAMSGIEFVSNDENSEMSIDRIDSNLGYTQDNVHLVLIVVNVMKMHHSKEFIVKICKAIAENNKDA